jgi:O-antigen/teichoic acid export membrane protein
VIRRGRLALGSSHLRGIARRLGWGVGDQAVSSLSNFLLGVFVVRSLGAADFGAFALAYLTYSLVLNASRGLSTDPLLVRYSGAEPAVWRRVAASASGTAIVVGTLAGLICIVVGLFLPPPLRGAFVGLGIGLPGLLLQDSWRFAFFAIGRGAQSLLNDLLWMFLLVGCLLSLQVTGRTTVFNCLLVFGLTATIAAAVGLLQSKVIPRPRQTSHWVHRHRDLGVRYLLENTTGSGAAQLRAMSLGIIAGLSAVGDVRAAEMLMGPFLVILMGVSQVAVPEASGVLVRHGVGPLRRFCLLLGGTQALAAALWGGALIVLLPDGVGELLLGPTWVAASKLVLPVTLAIVWGCFTVAAGAGLRARGAASRSLNAQLISCALYLSGGILGAIIAGASGTCWAAAGTAFVGALVWWDQLRRATVEELTTSPLAVASALPAGVTT